jgi:hypothetical protein
MSLETIHDVERGIVRLVKAPTDLRAFLPPQGEARPLAAATAAHGDLFARYLADFEVAYEIGENWWQGCVDAFIEQGFGRSDAIREAFLKRAAGPASAPEFVWFIRRYWLECDALNGALPESERIPPEILLVAWLSDAGRRDFLTMITCMPYWPLGLDENGKWC